MKGKQRDAGNQVHGSKALRIIGSVMVLSILLSLFSACSGTDGKNEATNSADTAVTSTTSGAPDTTTQAQTQTQTTANTPADSGIPAVDGGTLRIALNRAVGAQSIDPKFSDSTTAEQIEDQIYDGLWLRHDTEFLPGLANTWETSDEGHTLTFHLRDDVYFQPGKFQNGRLFTADDVKYTIERKQTDWQNSLYNVESVEVIDDVTVALHLRDPDANFFNNATIRVVPKEETEGWGDDQFCFHAVGTGPFKLVEHAPDQFTLLERNDNYWGGKPHLDEIEYRIITDSSQATNALLAGEIDLVLTLQGDGVTQVEQASGLTLKQSPGLTIAEVGFNTRKEALAKPEVRKALIQAVDFDQLFAGSMLNGEGSPNRFPAPKANWGYDESLLALLPSYDPEAAKKLLEEAGYGSGLELEIYYAPDEARTRAVTILESFYGKVGVKLISKPVATTELTEVYKSGNFDLFALTQGGRADPATFVGYYLNSNRLGTNYNAWYYNNPEADKLIVEGVGTTDQKRREEIYKELNTILLKENLGFWYATVNLTWGITDKLHGFEQESTGIFKAYTAGSDINVWLEK